MFLEVTNSNQQRLSFSSSLSSPSLSPGTDNCSLWLQRFAICGVWESHPPLSFLSSSLLPSPSQLFQRFISLHMPQSLPTLIWWPVLDFFHQVQIKQVSSITSSSQYHLSAFLENWIITSFQAITWILLLNTEQGALLCIELSLWALMLILPRFCGQSLDLSHNPCSLLCTQSNFSRCTLSATFSPSFFSASSGLSASHSILSDVQTLKPQSRLSSTNPLSSNTLLLVTDFFFHNIEWKHLPIYYVEMFGWIFSMQEERSSINITMYLKLKHYVFILL